MSSEMNVDLLISNKLENNLVDIGLTCDLEKERKKIEPEKKETTTNTKNQKKREE